jgi:hypothetical protein
LVLREDLDADDLCLLAIRHPSGSLTFHQETPAYSDRTTDSRQRVFRAPIRRSSGSDELGLFVLKLAATGSGRWEQAAWDEKRLDEGWFQVSPGGPSGLNLMPRTPPPDARVLVLLHGLLSDATATFGTLANTDFFDRVRELYGDRIYAFNYHSVSHTPLEAAQRALKLLSAGSYICDVVSHSSGGLVLRSIVEHERHGKWDGRIHLGRSVLTACPNEGTSLAAPARSLQMISWLASLLEVFPLNPFSFGWEFVSEALSWLAGGSGADAPGVRALDPAGQTMADFQSSPLPAPYSALVSNYHPDAALWGRALDVGFDDLFDSASDLIMPTEGGWRIRRMAGVQQATGRIGCFGPGGNLGSGTASVHHLNFFGRSDTAAFLAATLAGVHDELSPVDANAPLPSRRLARSTPAAIVRRIPATTPAPQPVLPRSFSEPDDWEAFHLLILSAGGPDSQEDDDQGRHSRPTHAHIVASYRGARVIEKIPLRREKDGPATRFGEIIGFERRIKEYTNHGKGTLPSDQELMEFGSLLFETLFQGNVRRLYDEARSRQRGTRLELVLTSTIPWMNEKPWELCYDKSRASFLATEEILFVRNVLSAIPADVIPSGDGQLRILIASAQAVSLEELSASQEEAVIRGGFQPLIDAGLVSIDILPRATPENIHRRLEMGRFNVVHFIGHGYFDEESQEGCLVFEDADGGQRSLGPRSVREIFCGRGLSVVFLNSCYSGTGSRFVNFSLGLAQTLVAHGLPALVANQFVVRDASATSFARCFYASLAQGNSIGHAALEARIAVNYSFYSESIDWAVPVLYTRNARLALCPRRQLDFEGSLLDLPSSGTRAIGGGQKRIGVWDVDQTFPALKQTLLGLNDAQSTYAFDSVELPKLPQSDDPALDPEEIANSVRHKIARMGVELLVCVTRRALRNQQRGWWSANRKTAVTVISCAGIELPAEGPLVDRVLTNAVVSSLARFFGGAGAHVKGSKACPLAFDPGRASESLTQPLKLDIPCLRTLQKSMRRELPALEALAKWF